MLFLVVIMATTRNKGTTKVEMIPSFVCLLLQIHLRSKIRMMNSDIFKFADTKVSLQFKLHVFSIFYRFTIYNLNCFWKKFLPILMHNMSV